MNSGERWRSYDLDAKPDEQEKYISTYPATITLPDGKQLKAKLQISEACQLGESVIDIPTKSGVEPTKSMADFNHSQIGDITFKELVEKVLKVPWNDTWAPVNGISHGHVENGYIEKSGNSQFWGIWLTTRLKPTEAQKERFKNTHHYKVSNSVKAEIVAELLEQQTGFKLEPLQVS